MGDRRTMGDGLQGGEVRGSVLYCFVGCCLLVVSRFENDPVENS